MRPTFTARRAARLRLVAPIAALAVLAGMAGPAAARDVTFTPGTIQVILPGCSEYLALVSVSWTGVASNGATQRTGPYTTFGTLDSIANESAYGWRQPLYSGTITVVVYGTYAPDTHIGSEITLLRANRPLAALGTPVASTFVDAGTCVSS